jgi:signal transduction histidine kinase/PAS domain-containing protein
MTTMPPKLPKASPERQQTDRSLHVERQKTDHELGRRETAIVENSDASVQRARGRADETLDEAREQADGKLERDNASGGQLQALGQERAQGDAALQHERLTADEKLIAERQERMRVLASLFRREREQTDERLLTERERADATLTARDDFMGMVFMQLPIPICMTRGREHVFELANPPYLRLVGKPELVGQSVRTAFPEIEGQPALVLMDQAFASGETVHGNQLPVRLDRGEGALKEERLFNFVYQPLLGLDGKVDGIVTFGFEVTEQVRARQKTQDAERRARFLGEASRLLGASLDFTVTLNSLARLALPSLADFCIVDVVDEDREITRIATAHVDAAKEKLLRELQRRHPPTWDSPQPAARVLRTGQFELLAETPDETILARTQNAEHAALMRQLGVRSYMAVPMHARGRTLGVLSFGLTRPGRRYTTDDLLLAQELAERAAYAVDNARLYSEAQQAIRLRDDFLSIASHELKTPLTPIQLYLQSLTQDTREDQTDRLDPVKLRQKLETIGRQVHRLRSLVNGLLDVPLFTGHRLRLELEQVDLSALISEVTARFQAEAEQTMTPLEVEVPAALVGEWDRLRVGQVITNLVGNALKFGKGRPVVVSATSDGESARLQVRDAGIGIAPEDQARIFQRFGRAVPTHHFGGFGLGLWMVRQIVEALRGTISVESEPGRGATFTVNLPLHASREATPAGAGAPTGRSSRSPNEKNPQPERAHTDNSLRSEREKSDSEYAKTQTAIEEETDTTIQQSRERADQVSQEARADVDVKLARSEAPAGAIERVHRERASEDAALEGERATYDMELRAEREERRRALAALLHLERDETDTRLLLERESSDEGLATRDEFMGMVSHDLRTLLAGVALQATLLKRNAATDEAGRRSVQGLEKIERFTARMNRLIGDLMDVASIEAGKFLVAPVLQDASALVRESVEAFHPLASAQGLSLDVEIRGKTLMARFDHERVLQVLANLLSNAIKFTRPGGRISIRLESSGQEVRCSVTDTGSGIPSQQLHAVFERFWQARDGDRRGLGLGLYISKCIVEAHGGRIWAESQPGAGSTFTFTLPGAGSGP